MSTILAALLVSFSVLTPGQAQLRAAYEEKALPVFVKYCAGCHASSNAPDYTDFMTAALDRGVIYNRVFVVGDMPWRLRVSFKEKAALRSWLLLEEK